ncbi:MAG: hypothetical protein QM723_01220 [Myxococcaceae bacterium]
MKTVAVLAALMLAAPALAEEPPKDSPPAEVQNQPEPKPLVRLSVEVDPLDYTLYKGWGVFVAARVAALPHWRFRIGGGAASMPSFIVDTTPENKGWSFRLDPVITFAAHYTVWNFHNERGGLFVGPVVGWMQGVFGAPSGGTATINTAFIGGDVGFRWYPFSKLGLVISPHFGFIATPGAKTPTVNGQSYKVPPISPQPQLLIGYEFDLGKSAS